MTTRTSIPKADVPSGPIPNRNGEAVLDGQTAYTTSTPISDALNDAGDGSVITIGPGTFTEQLSGFPANVTLIGAGPGTVIDGTDGEAIRADANGLRFIDLSARNDAGGPGLDAVFVESGVTDITFRGVKVPKSDAFGIRLKGDNITLNDCTVDDTDSAGISANTQVQDLTIVGCTLLSGVSGAGISSSANRLTAVGNTIDTPGAEGILIGGNNTTVVGNAIDSPGARGIRDNGSGANNTYGFNTVDDPTGDAFDFTSADNPTLYGNRPTASAYPHDHEWVQKLVDAPNGSIPNAVLDDGDSAEISIPVADGETLEVFRWGAYKISDGTTPADLDVELLDGSDTVQTTENTGDNESTDPSSPVASHTNSTGSVSIYKLAVANDTGGTITDPGVGAFFAYRVV